jgi:hypothetical protein
MARKKKSKLFEIGSLLKPDWIFGKNKSRRARRGIDAVSFSSRGRRGRGKRGLDAWDKMGGLGQSAFARLGQGDRRGTSRLGAIRDWWERIDYLDEQRRVMEDMENNPRAIADQIKQNRVMNLPGTSAVRAVVDMITRAAMRVQRRETKLSDKE